MRVHDPLHGAAAAITLQAGNEGGPGVETRVGWEGGGCGQTTPRDVAHQAKEFASMHVTASTVLLKFNA